MPQNPVMSPRQLSKGKTRHPQQCLLARSCSTFRCPPSSLNSPVGGSNSPGSHHCSRPENDPVPGGRRNQNPAGTLPPPGSPAGAGIDLRDTLPQAMQLSRFHGSSPIHPLADGGETLGWHRSKMHCASHTIRRAHRAMSSCNVQHSTCDHPRQHWGFRPAEIL